MTANLDLSFQPSDADSAYTLPTDTVHHYNRYGYAQPIDIYDDEEIAAIRSYVDQQMAALGEDGAYGINCYQARLATLWDIANDQRILDHVQDIIGPDIICWASAILSKPAYESRRVPWHQDARFWSLSPARTVTVWLAIDDADTSNAAMQFIPATHDKGAFAESDMGTDSVFHKGIAYREEFAQPVVNELRAGQISLHADMLVHGSEANNSHRRRCALTLRYCSPASRIVDKHWAQGVEAIICRGRDASGHWQHHPRPLNDDIRQTESPHVVGNN